MWERRGCSAASMSRRREPIAGQLLIGASTNAISGGFDSSGQSSNLVARAAEQGGPLTSGNDAQLE